MDSIPWESIDRLGQPVDHHRWYLIAAVIVAVGIGVSAVRNLGSSPAPVMGTTSTAVAVQETTTAPPATTAPDPALVTEADLMAIEPHLLERSAAAFAEVAAVEYFSGFSEGIWAEVAFDLSRSTFVEYAVAVEVTRREPFLFDVLVAVSVLDAAPLEEFVRRPVRGISIVVDASDERLRPVGLPSPARLPFGSFKAPTSEAEPIDEESLDRITEAARQFGEARAVEFRRAPSGGGSATVTIVDAGGIGWPMRLDLDADGVVSSLGEGAQP